jgi:hypothetical protein
MIIFFYYMASETDVALGHIWMSEKLYRRLYPDGYRTGFEGSHSDAR